MKEQQDITLIDIRDPAAYEEGHIEDALRVDDHNVAQFIERADLEKPLVVYCYHGNNSQGAADYMNQQGFKTAYSLQGGFAAWTDR